MFLAFIGDVLAVSVAPSMGADFCPAYVALAHAQAMCLRCVCVVLEALLPWRGATWGSSSVAFLLI